MSLTQIASLARKFNCELELFHTRERSAVFSAEAGEIHSKDAIFTEGYAVRAIKNKQLGFYPFENPEDIEKSVANALKLAKLQERGDYHFANLNGISKKFFDSKCTLFEEWGIPALEEMVEVHSEKKVKSIQNIIGSTQSEDQILTSNGNEVTTVASAFFAVSQCGYKETEADDSFSSAKYSFSPAETAKKAAEFAIASAGAKNIDGGKAEVVFDIRALNQLLQIFLPFNFSAESCRKNLSKLKTGAAFSSNNITILDDPSMNDGSRPSEYDDEGFKSIAKSIVKNGKVGKFISNMQTAAKMKSTLSGNGFRPSFSAPPIISFSDISIEGGEVKDLVSECESGIYVNSFLTSGANQVTGDFSFPLLVAFMIRNGEAKEAIKGMMMKGNFFELMRNAKFERDTIMYNGLRSGRMSCELEIIS